MGDLHPASTKKLSMPVFPRNQSLIATDISIFAVFVWP